jgi:transposase
MTINCISALKTPAPIARVEATLPSTAAKTPTAKSQSEGPSLPTHLHREDMRFGVENRACPCCGGTLHMIGETVSEMLDQPPDPLIKLVTRHFFGIDVCTPGCGCDFRSFPNQAPLLRQARIKGRRSRRNQHS